MKDKKVDCSKTKVSISEMVLPNHTNNLNTLFGGKLMYWMDMAAGICAYKNTKKIAVTASVDNISFKSPVYKGDIVNVLSKKNQIICVGITAYPAKDAKIIAGAKSKEIENLLGYHSRDVIIHRDDMVLRK